MSIMQKLFSFQGRLRRRDFWILTILVGVAAGIVYGVAGMIFGGSMAAVDQNDPAAVQAAASNMLMTMLPVYGVTALVTAWPYLAIQIKRWHDRDKSGWWVLIGLIPFVGPIWALVECGFLDGTPGPNRFGPSPKGVGGTAESFA